MKNKIKAIIKSIIFLKFLSSIYNFYFLKKAKIKTPKNFVINGRLFIYNKGQIILGNNIRINSGKNYNIIGGDTRTNIVVSKNALFKISENVGLSNSTFVCRKSIIIENDVLIGGNCKFYDTDFHSLNYSDRMRPYIDGIPDVNIVDNEILIKKGAFIGGHSIILKGVTIGENSIVGAGSVVSKNIPDNQIWAGNPVKFIKNINNSKE